MFFLFYIKSSDLKSSEYMQNLLPEGDAAQRSLLTKEDRQILYSLIDQTTVSFNVGTFGSERDKVFTFKRAELERLGPDNALSRAVYSSAYTSNGAITLNLIYQWEGHPKRQKIQEAFMDIINYMRTGKFKPSSVETSVELAHSLRITTLPIEEIIATTGVLRGARIGWRLK